MPGPTVYLHIGLAKTGTTYLQALLWHNRRLLDRHGLRYPGRMSSDQFYASIDLRQRPFAGQEHTLVPGTWDAVASQAAAAPDRAVISHETLSRTHRREVRRAAQSFAGCDLHLIVTVRDLARQLPAAWQEQVKNRAVRSYEGFLRDVAERPKSRRYRHFWEGHDVLDVLDRWSAAVPPERVHIVTVPQRGADPGLLWERFASVIGVEPSLVETDVPTSNVSLGVAEAELLRRLNPGLRRRMDWPSHQHLVKGLLTERLAARRGSVRLSVPQQRRAWVRDRAEQMVEGLAKGGYDVVGSLDELRPVFDDGRVLMPKQVPAKQLFAIAGECVGDLLSDPVHDPRRFVGARRRAKALLHRWRARG
jgi:hypothetical protein